MKKEITFSSDSQLLAELGERLIATPQIALGELVKNAYDADATKVNIWFSEKGKVLNVRDDGNGMSEDNFCNGWMRIAGSQKVNQEVSRRFKRPLTGSKGVGRFAVRLLGNALVLESAPKPGSGLRATFPWSQFAAGSGIDEKPITYWTDLSGVEKGTWLKISELRQSWGRGALEQISGDVLQLQTPYFADVADRERPGDPGFKIFFAPPGEEQEIDDSTAEIFGCAAIKLKIRLRKQRATFSFTFASGRKSEKYEYEFPDFNLVGHVDADIRFLPKRPGAFSGLKNFDGRKAAAWVRKNGGVRVFDRGFRVPPYGFPDDDWLQLSEHVAARRRTWASDITNELFPPPEKVPKERLHPALHLPANHQILGYVSIKSHSPKGFVEGQRKRLLQPEMDRQGFVRNEGFSQLYNLVRGGIEILAILDLEEELRKKKEARKKSASDLREKIAEAIEEVSNNADIPPKVRRSIGVQLKQISARAKRAEDARDEAEVAIETLGLLGVVAAFMTHEMTSILRDVNLMLTALDRMKPNDAASVENAKKSARSAHQALTRHIDYVRRFAANVRARPDTRFKALPAIKEIMRQFEYFTEPRRIAVELEVPSTLQAPPIPLAVYSGLILNLYTNSLKAVLAKRDGTERRIRVEATQEDGSHVIRVSDSGIGVSPALRSKIFDPLFSTTAEDGPLGPGMGMGLYIVRRVMKSLEGRAKLITAPDGFETSFELRIPNG